MPAPKTFKFFGTIAHHYVIILIDSGSMHNFVQSQAAKFLNLPSTLCVMVGNGSTLDFDTSCPQIPIDIQGHTFTIDLFSLPLSGADIVFKVQWLKLLGPITTDYVTLTMTFSYLGQPISLQADVPFKPTIASAQQVKRLAHTHNISALFHITHIPDQAHFYSLRTPDPDTSTPPTIDLLFCHFDDIFQEPSQLPPHRNIAHNIHLVPNSTLVNIKTYHYPYCQKNELET